MPRYTEAQKAEAVRLRRSGLSERATARQMGMARTTVKRLFEAAQAAGGGSVADAPAAGGEVTALELPEEKRMQLAPSDRLHLHVQVDPFEALANRELLPAADFVAMVTQAAEGPLVVADSRKLPAPVRRPAEDGPEVGPAARPGLSQRVGRLVAGVGELAGYTRFVAAAVPVAGVGMALWLWPKVARRFAGKTVEQAPADIPASSGAPLELTQPGESDEWGGARSIG